MDAGTSSLLESATLKTIHAQSFSRASSRASHVLTDLLSRYISLLATTCARYAEHSGRASVSVHDAFLALDELGLSMDELVEYAEGEAHELTRYNSVTTRRVEELVVLNGRVFVYCVQQNLTRIFADALTEGRKLDQDDAVPLVYAEMNTPAVTDDESDGSDDEVEKPEVHLNGDIPLVNGTGPRGTKRAASPLLPISPISNPSSPSRKRPRLQPGWDPPPHIPDFLPPFPTNILDTEVNALQSPQIKTEAEATLPPPASANGLERERLPTPPPQQLSTATSAADYLTPVPYNMSSLSTLPEGHLPDSNLRTVPTPASSALQLLPRKHEPPQIMPSILTAYHHVLTQKPPPEPSINPGRHRVALTMIDQSYTHPRWSAPDTLFANLSAARPRVVAPARAFAVFAGSAPGKEDKQLVIPSTLKTLVVDETILPLSHQPTSRMPDIARAILPVSSFFNYRWTSAKAASSITCALEQHVSRLHHRLSIRKIRRNFSTAQVCLRHGTQILQLQTLERARKNRRGQTGKAGSATRHQMRSKTLFCSQPGIGKRTMHVCQCRQINVDELWCLTASMVTGMVRRKE